MPGFLGASSGGRGGGGTVGARIRGARGLGPGGGGGLLGDHTIWGGGGVATRNTGPYMYIYIYKLCLRACFLACLIERLHACMRARFLAEWLAHLLGKGRLLAACLLDRSLPPSLPRSLAVPLVTAATHTQMATHKWQQITNGIVAAQ